MMFSVKLVLLACWIESVTAETRASQEVTPVEKVIELLASIDKQIEDEGTTEASQYDKYACFCREQADIKKSHIERSEDKIASLDAEIDKLDADITVLNTDIGALGKKIEQKEEDIKKETGAREIEHEKYIVDDKDMSDAISACKGAIESLKKSKKNLKGKTEMEAKMFLQVKKVAALGLAFAATESRGSAIEASQLEVLRKLSTDKQPGKAYEYSYHSNDIISVLESLLQSFKKNQDDLYQTECDAKTKFDREVLDLSNERTFAKKSKDEKERIEAGKTEDKAIADKDRADEEKAKTADESFVTELKTQCEAKAELFDERSKVRAKELALINEALQSIKTSVAESWKANRHLNGLVTKKQAKVVKQAAVQDGTHVASFLQLSVRHSASKEAEVRQQLLDVLNGAAKRVGTSVLTMTAMKVQLADDHFVKVRSLINDIIARLEDQAAAEATTKSFCNKHMKDTVTSRDSEQAAIEAAKATLTQKEAEKAELLADKAELTAAIAEDRKTLNEATEFRLAEQKDNDLIVTQAKAGELAVENAIEILQDFYDEHEFVQTGAKSAQPSADREGKTVGDRAPEIFKDKYRGTQKAGKGPIGMLNWMMNDFERTVDVTKDNEDDAQRAYDKFKKKIEDENFDRQDQIDDKQTELDAVDDEMVTLMDDLKSSQELLKGAMADLDKLRPICVEGEETYEERVARRAQEIEALRKAHDILDNWQ